MFLSGLDELDQKILALLVENARYSYSEIGEKLGYSRVAIKNHVDALGYKGLSALGRSLTNVKIEELFLQSMNLTF